jgi:SPP1 gp7 family putative phage head morphogenesis protein
MDAFPTPDPEPYADYLERVFVTSHLLGRETIYDQAKASGLDFSLSPSLQAGRGVGGGVSSSPFEEGQGAVSSPPSLDGRGKGRVKFQALNTPLEIEAARRFLLTKPLMTDEEFDRLDANAKRRAFTISRVENTRILADVRQAIADAIQPGVTPQELEQAAIRAFQTYGVTQQSPYHAATVFRTNIQTAFHDARWQMMNAPGIQSEIAYLRYITKDDARVRANHRPMHNVIRPIDDPIWSVWYPPNGFNCRCSVEPVMRAEAEARSLQPTEPIPDVRPDPGFESGPGQL